MSPGFIYCCELTAGPGGGFSAHSDRRVQLWCVESFCVFQKRLTEIVRPGYEGACTPLHGSECSVAECVV